MIAVALALCGARPAVAESDRTPADAAKGNITIRTLGDDDNVPPPPDPNGRHLDDATRAALLNVLPKGRPIDMTFEATAIDAAGYAEEIRSFLAAQGFDVKGLRGALIHAPDGTIPRGFTVGLN